MNIRQLISTQQFTHVNEVDFILNLAEKMEPYAFGDNHLDYLKNKIIALLFYEPSTRTKLSFYTAALRLGAKVITENDINCSSLSKGETIEDTMKIISQYADLIVMRHPHKGSAEKAISCVKTPFINAGDGPGQHPTQSLIDVYTIRKEQRKINNLHIALVGDLKYGRTVHSLISLLKYYAVKITLVSPPELTMPAEYKQIMDKANIIYKETDNLESVIGEIDVLYMTRIQQERFSNLAEYEKLKNSFILKSNLLKSAKDNLTILHPLPRINEISPEIDDFKGAAYFRQAGNGVSIRMALLLKLLNQDNLLTI